MNKKGNQRAVQTENKIKWTFLNLLKEMDISRISVSEICARAQIHRTTFYVHYKDVADLMEHLVGEMYEQILFFFTDGEEGLKSGGFCRLFELVREHREFFATYLETVGDLTLTYDNLPEPLQDKIEKIVPAMGYTSREELMYHQTFFCEGLSAVIRRWVKRGCVESPEEMEHIIEREYRGAFKQRKMEEEYEAI